MGAFVLTSSAKPEYSEDFPFSPVSFQLGENSLIHSAQLPVPCAEKMYFYESRTKWKRAKFLILGDNFQESSRLSTESGESCSQVAKTFEL
jgi:hypothetical protein